MRNQQRDGQLFSGFCGDSPGIPHFQPLDRLDAFKLVQMPFDGLVAKLDASHGAKDVQPLSPVWYATAATFNAVCTALCKCFSHARQFWKQIFQLGRIVTLGGGKLFACRERYLLISLEPSVTTIHHLGLCSGDAVRSLRLFRRPFRGRDGQRLGRILRIHVVGHNKPPNTLIFHAFNGKLLFQRFLGQVSQSKFDTPNDCFCALYS
jgi:hypothetical protein